MKPKFNGIYSNKSLNELWSTESGTFCEMGIFLFLLLVPFCFSVIHNLVCFSG